MRSGRRRTARHIFFAQDHPRRRLKAAKLGHGLDQPPQGPLVQPRHAWRPEGDGQVPGSPCPNTSGRTRPKTPRAPPKAPRPRALRPPRPAPVGQGRTGGSGQRPLRAPPGQGRSVRAPPGRQAPAARIPRRAPDALRAGWEAGPGKRQGLAVRRNRGQGRGRRGDVPRGEAARHADHPLFVFLSLFLIDATIQKVCFYFIFFHTV